LKVKYKRLEKSVHKNEQMKRRKYGWGRGIALQIFLACNFYSFMIFWKLTFSIEEHHHPSQKQQHAVANT